VRELLKELLRHATAGEPMGGLRWTHKTTRNLAAALVRRGVPVGHVTAAFAVRAIRLWWLRVGRRRYPRVSRLAIEADSGGANGNRCWAWKVGLQDLADEFGLTITVGHYPAGTSKWNPLEHRMFNLISANWAGEPLTSYEVMLKYIRTTRSSTGFRCRAALDTRFYPTKVKVSEEAKATVRLSRHAVLPKWNYTIRSRKRNG
jgi:hypothetical protein